MTTSYARHDPAGRDGGNSRNGHRSKTVLTDGMAEWQAQATGPGLRGRVHRRDPGEIHEGQVANRPVYLALGVTADGTRDILGLWAGEHGDGEGCGTPTGSSGVIPAAA